MFANRKYAASPINDYISTQKSISQKQISAKIKLIKEVAEMHIL